MLDRLRREKCPECGCTRIKSYLKSNQHSNGNWNEELIFDCGYKETFSPNFMAIKVVEDSCRYSEKLKEKERIDREALLKLSKYINKLKCSDKLKEKLQKEVKI